MVLICILGFVSDALISKSRYVIICIGFLLVVLNIFNVYFNVVGSHNYGVVLFEYNIQGVSYNHETIVKAIDLYTNITIQ